MAETVVVKEDLSEKMIQGGAALVRALEAEGWLLIGAFWLYSSEANRWRLVLASPKVQSEGPLEAYRQIRHVLERMAAGEPRLKLENTTVTDENHPFVPRLRRFASMATSMADGEPGYRVTSAGIEGRLVEDAYVYPVRGTEQPEPEVVEPA